MLEYLFPMHVRSRITRGCRRLAAMSLAALAWANADAADGLAPGSGAANTVAALSWPAVTQSARPWTYWWWMGSAVDRTNLTLELERYRDAGLGGVHIIPIYGAKGFEDRFIDYLSPKWMEMLRYTVAEARRLGLGVDMTAGSGWCFGGPRVSETDANALVVAKTYDLLAGQRLPDKFDSRSVQALVAFSAEGRCVELTIAPELIPPLERPFKF